MIKYRLKIIDIVNEAKGTKTYYFEKPKELTWEAGSHTHIGIIGFDEGEKPNKSLVRHMSIMTLPTENKVGFTTRIPNRLSEFKSKLSNLNVDDEIVMFKLGSKLALRRCNRPIILLSMGVGIAAMRPIILNFIKNKSNIPYLVNVNVDSSNDFIFKDELDNLSDETYKNYWLNSRKAFYTELEQLTQIDNPIYYIVGSYEFIKETIQNLKSKNVNISDIVIDQKDEVLNQLFGA